MTPPPLAPTLVCSKKSLLALSYSILDAARQPSQGGCWASSETQEARALTQ